MDQTGEYTPEQLEKGRVLFAGESTFIMGAAKIQQIPPDTLPEVAFAGRSNVGKSSLLNALTGRKKLARTSNTPGRTQEINFFDMKGQLMLVDLPGYGYAKVSRTLVTAWTDMLRKYLKGRASLRRALVLVDSRHGIKPSDKEIMEMMDESAVAYQIILTKIDKLKKGELEKRIKETKEVLKKHPAAFPEPYATSSVKGTGIAELKAALAMLSET